MKCRNCGIHYLDEDNECPLCGKKKSIGDYISGANKDPYSDHTSKSSFDSAKNTANQPILNGNKQSPKKNKALKIILTVIILFYILPFVISILLGVINTANYMIPENGFSYNEEIALPEPEYIYNDTTEDFDGTWYCEQTDETIVFFGSDHSFNHTFNEQGEMVSGYYTANYLTPDEYQSPLQAEDYHLNIINLYNDDTDDYWMVYAEDGVQDIFLLQLDNDRYLKFVKQ